MALTSGRSTVVGEVDEKHRPLGAFRDRDAFVLLAAELSPQESRRVSVCVLDVAKRV